MVITRICDMWERDMNLLTDSLKTRGVLFALAFICIASICIIKTFDIIIKSMCNQEDKVLRELYRSPSENNTTRNSLARIPKRTTWQNDNSQDMYSSERNKISNAMDKIRNEILLNHGKLIGMVLKTTFVEISDEELYNSILTDSPLRSCIIQQVTFGNSLNKAINTILPQYKFVNGKSNSYLVLDENEAFSISEDIGNLVNEQVNITLKDKKGIR